MRAIALSLALISLAACTQTPGTPPSEGLRFAQGPAFSVPIGSDPVMTSVLSASSFLGDPPRRLGGRPALAAQVAAQFEFATEALREPRFVGYSPLMQIQMVQGRAALRETIGIAQDAAPELVVERLTALAGALQRADTVAAEQLATVAPFVRPAAEVLATLRQMPPVPAANWAALFAERELTRSDAGKFRRN